MHPSQIGPYRIVKLLGAGGMGVVYEAIQEPIQRRVALKLLLPQFAQHNEALTRFFNEACVVNLIEHPSIVQVSDYGQTADGAAYLVMECLRGESLSARLKGLHANQQRLPILDALHIAAQIADALTSAHTKDVVHRDLKPANIMLVRDPVAPGGERAKILDFGIAKLTQGQGSETAANAVIGTPQYMSPEQCRGAGGVDDRTDVYALGVMLYEMLAGRTPFLGNNGIDYMAQHSFDQPPPLRSFAPTVPYELTDFTHRLLNKNKAERPPMRMVAQELVRLTRPATGTGLPVISMPPVAQPISQPMMQQPMMQQPMMQQPMMQPVMQQAPMQQAPQTPMSQPMMLVSAPMAPVAPLATIMPGPASTLGVSGQTLPPPPTRRSRRVLVGVGAGLGVVIVVGILSADWLSGSKPAPTPAVQPAAPRLTRPSVPVAPPTPMPEAAPVREAAPVKKPEKPVETHVKPKAQIVRHTPLAGPRRGPVSRTPQSNSSPPPGKKLIPVED